MKSVTHRSLRVPDVITFHFWISDENINPFMWWIYVFSIGFTSIPYNVHSMTFPENDNIGFLHFTFNLPCWCRSRQDDSFHHVVSDLMSLLCSRWTATLWVILHPKCFRPNAKSARMLDMRISGIPMCRPCLTSWFPAGRDVRHGEQAMFFLCTMSNMPESHVTDVRHGDVKKFWVKIVTFFRNV